jgi:hypothetical protein
MSAVVSFVEDAFDAVGDVFEAVGDVVEDVVDFVGDAVEKVGDVVQAVIDDPLPVLLSVAGSFVGIPPAITMGAVTAARGGDLEDIALSMGTAYFAPSVGNAISSTVSSAFIEAGVNETFSQVASSSISKGLVNGAIAEIKGGSFEDGFAGGFTGGMVAGGVGEVANYVKPDVIDLALESGLDLQDANAIFSAGTRAFSSGITSEITGRGDFATSFTNSAVGSGIDYGVRELNTTIDEQFRTAATDWNEKDSEGEPVEVATTGAGIPNEIVGQVTVSGYGVENEADTIDFAEVLADSQEARDANNASSSYTGETATSNISVLPETQLAEAPQGETVYDFADLIDEGTPVGSAPAENISLSDVIADAGLSDTGLSNNTSLSDVIADAGIYDVGLDGDYYDETSLADITGDEGLYDTPESVIDIAENIPTDEAPATSVEPKGALTTIAETTVPAVDLDTSKPAVVSEAPVAENLLTAGLAAEQPTGGLNAVAQAEQATPQAKMASSMGFKPTDITKPMVATVGNLLKQTLTQKKRPAQRAPARRPAGGLQMANAKPTVRKAPPARMDVASLIPIQKATPLQKTAKAVPAKTLGKDAKLTPITDIATLTSLVKNSG